MTNPEQPSTKLSRVAQSNQDERVADEVSIVALANVLLRRPRPVVAGVVIGGLLALLVIFTRDPRFTASASFVASGGERGRPSTLSSLAGQLGVAFPIGDQAQSPEFYAYLIESRELLSAVVKDSLRVPELGNTSTSLIDVFGFNSGSRQRDSDDATGYLGDLVGTSVTKTTGVVSVSVATPWPSVSLAIIERLVKGVNDFNLRTRQSQAVAERRFLEGRLKLAQEDLRRAEERLEEFMRTNRQVGSSPDLMFASERLQRHVTLQAQLVTAFSQGYEDARIREVRDTPVITTVESPSVPTRPDRQRRILTLLLGLFGGAVIGSGIAFFAEISSQAKSGSRPEVTEFLANVSGLWARVRPTMPKRAAKHSD